VLKRLYRLVAVAELIRVVCGLPAPSDSSGITQVYRHILNRGVALSEDSIIALFKYLNAHAGVDELFKVLDWHQLTGAPLAPAVLDQLMHFVTVGIESQLSRMVSSGRTAGATASSSVSGVQHAGLPQINRQHAAAEAQQGGSHEDMFRNAVVDMLMRASTPPAGLKDAYTSMTGSSALETVGFRLPVTVSLCPILHRVLSTAASDPALSEPSSWSDWAASMASSYAQCERLFCKWIDLAHRTLKHVGKQRQLLELIPTLVDAGFPVLAYRVALMCNLPETVRTPVGITDRKDRSSGRQPYRRGSSSSPHLQQAGPAGSGTRSGTDSGVAGSESADAPALLPPDAVSALLRGGLAAYRLLPSQLQLLGLAPVSPLAGVEARHVGQLGLGGRFKTFDALRQALRAMMVHYTVRRYATIMRSTACPHALCS